MARKFDYNQKDSYSQEDLDAILGQHSSFLNVEQLTADLATAQGELKPFKTQAKEDRLVSLIPETGNKKYAKDFIKLSELSEDMDDAAITKAFQATLDEREYLKAPVVDDKAGIKKESFKSVEKTEQSSEDFKKEQRLRNV